MGLEREPNVTGQLGMIESQLLAAEAVKKLVGNPSEQELRAEYAKERAGFETVELSHILVAYQGGQVPPRSGQPLTIPQALQKATAIAALVRGGQNFAQVAASESDDQQTATQGGALGPVPISAVPPEMRPAIENLKPGEISAPVRTSLGIHVFRAGNRQSKTFEEVRPMLDQKIKQGRVQSAITKAVAGAKVEKDPKFFAAQVQPGGKSSS
jgi:peptidylprolyl isomerase